MKHFFIQFQIYLGYAVVSIKVEHPVFFYIYKKLYLVFLSYLTIRNREIF